MLAQSNLFVETPEQASLMSPPQMPYTVLNWHMECVVQTMNSHMNKHKLIHVKITLKSMSHGM